MRLSVKFPRMFFHIEGLPGELRAVFKVIARTMESLQRDIADAVNHNEVQFHPQDAQPSLAEGQLWIWKDTDAASGQPTHYLVYDDGTDTVTFASQETVP